MFAYLKEVIDSKSTATRNGFALVTATIALSLATVILSIAACFGQDVAIALGTVTVPLGGLGGYAYGKAKDAGANE